MVGVAPEDADPTAKRRAPSSHEDAFAQTITPQPAKLASGTETRGDDATVAAPLTKPPAQPVGDDAPPLHEVPASLYRTEREIARGGMGRITAAEDRRLGRPVALKE